MTYSSTYEMHINPIHCIVKHLALLHQGFEVEADEPLCMLIEHIETGGWVPTLEQVKKACRRAKLPLRKLDLTYIHTIHRFKHWRLVKE